MPAKMKLADIDCCFELLSQRQPDPQTELHFTDPFTLLVAVVLSAQATDVGVNRATKGLFAAASTPAAMVELGVEEISHHIRTTTLWAFDLSFALRAFGNLDDSTVVKS